MGADEHVTPTTEEDYKLMVQWATELDHHARMILRKVDHPAKRHLMAHALLAAAAPMIAGCHLPDEEIDDEGRMFAEMVRAGRAALRRAGGRDSRVN